MTHYICKGSCKGMTEEKGKSCGAVDCDKHDQPLDRCDCEDGTHSNNSKN